MKTSIPSTSSSVPSSTVDKLTKGLGWFSVALGAMELIAPRALTRSLGMKGNEGLMRFYALREIAAGMGILRSKNPARWLWARVLGDAMDIGSLSAHFNEQNRQEKNVGVAIGHVALITALDVYCAKQLTCRSRSAKIAQDDVEDPSSLAGQKSDEPTPGQQDEHAHGGPNRESAPPIL